MARPAAKKRVGLTKKILPPKKALATKKTPAKKKLPAKKIPSATIIAAKPKNSVQETKKNPPIIPSKTGDFDGWLSIRALSELLGYDPKTIRNYISDKGGPVEKAGSGRAAKVHVGEWHKFLLAIALGKGNKISDTKHLKVTEELRKQKRENDLAENELVHVSEVIYFFNSLLVILANRLNGISGKAAAGDPELRNRILDETKHAQLGIFNDIVEYLRPFVGDGAADTAAADASKLGVGQRK
jgi:hypothetical protein